MRASIIRPLNTQVVISSGVFTPFLSQHQIIGVDHFITPTIPENALNSTAVATGNTRCILSTVMAQPAPQFSPGRIADSNLSLIHI